MLNRQGQVRHCLTSVRVYRELGIIEGSILDITERKRTDEALSESEARFRTLFETMTQGVILTDHAGWSVAVNSAAERILKMPAQDILGHGYHNSAWKVIHEDGSEFPLEEQPISTALRTGEPVTATVLGLHNPRSKEFKWLCVTVLPKRDPGTDAVNGVYSIFEDITERKRIQKALQLTQFSVNHAADPVLWMRPDGSYSYVNDAACRLLGYTPEELLTMGAYDVAPEHPREKWAQHWEMLKQQKALSFETIFRTKHGYLLPVEISANFVTFEGQDYNCAFVRDISERKRAEGALRESEERFRIMADNSPILLWVTDAEGGNLFVNRTYREFFGVDFQQVNGPHWQPLIHPEDSSDYVAAFLDAVRSKTAFKAEVRAQRADGEWRWMTSHAETRFAPTGEFLGHIGITLDITDRKLAEEERRKSEEKYRIAFMSNPDACYLATMQDGLIVEVNSGFEAIYGYTRDQCIGVTSPELNLWANYADRDRMLAALEANGSVSNFIVRSRRSSGELFDVNMSVTSLLIDGASYIYGIIKDVTEQVRAVQALSDSERQYWTLIDFLPMGVLVHREGKILLANQKSSQIFGMQHPDDLIGTSMIDLVHPEERENVIQRVKTSMASGDWAEQREERLLRHNGDTFVAEVTGLPILFGGLPSMLVVFDDITKRLSAEEEHTLLTQQLRQSQKMEAVGRLAGGVAHDFNNLLTVMTGHAEMALMQLRKDDPLRPEVEEIEKTAQRAANLTRQLLAFSRRQVMAPVVLDVNEIVFSMNRMLRRIIGENIHLETSPAEHLWNVKADPGQIEQVIANLAVNARDAMPGGGSLAIETANVTLDEEFTKCYPEAAVGPHVLLSVTDTGIGMSPEIQARIFEPFFTTKPMGEGTGLGLATVYGIVTQSGGHILVHSAVGHGTTFSIYLPIALEEPGNAPVRIAASRRLKGTESILLVEDSGTVRKMLTRVLEQYGYRVTAASSAEDAQEICRKVPAASLVLTDVVLPGINGVDLANWIRRQWPSARILLMSGYTADAIPSTAADLGLDLLQKPFGPVQLITKIRETLDH